VVPRNYVLDEVQIPTFQGAILGSKRDGPRTLSDSQYIQSHSAGGQHRYSADAD